MLSHKLAQLLLRKAEQDQFIISRLIDDPETPEEVLGFHAQQAVEKMLKAVLASRGVRYRRTHDLVELIDLLRQDEVPFPDELEEVRRLTPFATEFRCEEFLEEAESPFDRARIQAYVNETRAWAQSMLGD